MRPRRDRGPVPPLDRSHRGMRPFMPDDLLVLGERAEAAGAPPTPAAIAWALSEQNTVGWGDDGRIWVSGSVGITTYDGAQLLAALRAGYRAWRRCLGVNENPVWLAQRVELRPDLHGPAY